MEEMENTGGKNRTNKIGSQYRQLQRSSTEKRKKKIKISHTSLSSTIFSQKSIWFTGECNQCFYDLSMRATGISLNCWLYL